MKTILSFAFIVIFSFSLKAQSSDDIGIIQSLWGMEKRTMVEEYMDLSPAEASAFWSQYEIYEEARKALGKERIGLINEYVENFGSLTDDKAAELINGAASNNIAIQKLLQKTFKKMSKVISPVKAAQFVQLENYLMSMIQLSIQDELPFIGELEEMVND
jgi:hypothetical protein